MTTISQVSPLARRIGAPGLQQPMTLVMALADPSDAGIEALFADAFGLKDLDQRLRRVATIHSARFVIVENNLVMASTYDSSFEQYIFAFIVEIGKVFNAILRHVVDPPPLPVWEHPNAFIEWVRARNVASALFHVASKLTVQEMQQLEAAVRGPDVALSGNDLPDVQGLIVRGFGHPTCCHVAANIEDRVAARTILARLAEPDATGATWVSSAALRRGSSRPAQCGALGISASGFRALGLSEDALATFPIEFREGAATRAIELGDWAASSPDNWHFTDADVVFSVYAQGSAALDDAVQDLEHRLGTAFRVVFRQRAETFSEERRDYVHFGYRDNISQPQIAVAVSGYYGTELPEKEQSRPGEFLLGHRGAFGGVNLAEPGTATGSATTPIGVVFDQPVLGEAPKDSVRGVNLCANGSYSAFRIMEQHVDTFANFLQTTAVSLKRHPEWVAAQVVGRYRDGTPLAQTVDANAADPITAPLTYAKDPDGLRCPLGAHIRRANPRDQTMLPARDGERRRIMRRAMPYGPEWMPGEPTGGVERGLVGHFIGADLGQQFETVLGGWMSRGTTSPRITGTSDPLVGAAVPDGSGGWFAHSLDIANSSTEVTRIDGLGQFVTTRACVYLFLPSLSLIRALPNLLA